jgi:hypothetical protein
MFGKFLPYGQFLVLPAIVVLYFCWRLRRRLLNPLIGLPLLLIALALIAPASYSLWYFHRPFPDEVRRELAPGVHFSRHVRTAPRPLDIHVVEINLDQPGLEFLVTPSDSADKIQQRARTTSDFVRQFNVQVAINASYFYPFHSDGPFNFYPHAGDPCTACGECVSRGEWYSPANPEYHLLGITKDNRVEIGDACRRPYNAVCWRDLLLKDGELVPNLDDGPPLMPCTAVAIDKTGRKMYWIIIDGRQPNHSEGVTVKELAGICEEFGGWNAVALDGGGSSTLVARDAGGEPAVLNCPIHGRHPPGRERPVANHLGLIVRQH